MMHVHADQHAYTFLLTEIRTDVLDVVCSLYI